MYNSSAKKAVLNAGIRGQSSHEVECVCRVELCTSSGAELKSFGLDECEGGPHEFRGVKRSSLLEALQKVVPSECVQYNSVAARQHQRTLHSSLPCDCMSC